VNGRARRIRALVTKEAFEILANRWLLLTVFGVPAAVVVLTVLNVASLAKTPLPASALPEALRGSCDGLSDNECAQVHLGRTFGALYLLLPMILPSAIAAYGIVGEKRGRTLEPLLATPLRTGELLVAKVIAAVLPGIAAAWLGYGLWLGAVRVLTGPGLVGQLTSPAWGLAIAFLGPLFALLATTVGLMVSSRATDPRAAQQVASLLILPVVAGLVGQLTGAVVLTIPVTLALIAGAALANAVLLALAVRIFDREAILTRWS